MITSTDENIIREQPIANQLPKFVDITAVRTTPGITFSFNPDPTPTPYDKSLDMKVMKNIQKNLSNLPPPLKAEKISVRDVFMFGQNPGFCLGEATVKAGESSLPGAFLASGNAAAVFTVIYEEGGSEPMVLVTEQFRIGACGMDPDPENPTQHWYRLEAPAGMVDPGATFRGTAAKEMEEETGITVPADELHELFKGHPSVGRTTEELTIYYFEKILSKEKYKDVLTTLHGNREDGEFIRIRAIPLSNRDLIHKCGDFKLSLGYELYMLKKSK